MADLVFKKRGVINVEIYGDTFKVRKPSLLEVEEIGDKFSKLEPTQQNQKTKEFLENLGIPMDVLNSMDADHYIALCEGILNPKKK